MSAVGYVWLSPEQTEVDDALKADMESLDLYGQANGFSLADVVVECGTVGSALERPRLTELLSRPGITVVVPSMASLGRRFHDVATVLSEVSARGLRLISIAEGIDTHRPEGKQILAVLAAIPQVARMMRTAPADAPKVYVRSRQVLHNGGTCPFGYSVEESTNQIRVVPTEAAAVRRIFQERRAGRSLRQIANGLVRDGISTKRGGHWHANTVKTILGNLVYTGAYQFQDRIFHDDHEAIISMELFRNVNASDDLVQVVG